MSTTHRSTLLARQVVAGAKPGEAVEVCAGSAQRTEVRVHGGEVESLTVAESMGVGVRVIRDGREGFAHAGSWDDDVVAHLLSEARDNARFAEPDERVGLAEPDGYPVVEHEIFDERLMAESVDAKVDLALAVEAATRAADPRVRGVRASIYADGRGESALVSTTGIDAWDRAASASLSTSVLLDDTDGRTQTGWAAEAAAAPQDLDPQKVAQTAVDRAVQLLGATRPSTGRPQVVLEPRFVGTVLGIVAAMLSGERVVKGRTPFADRVGEAIATTALTLFDDPTDPEALGGAAIDGEGLACRRVPLITDGHLAGFLHDARSARGLNTSSTGSAIRSVRGTPSPGHRVLHVAAGTGDLESLVQGIDDGVLVCSLQGLHSGVNAVSGDFSVGVEGVRICDGALTEPFREATLAGTIPRLLLDLVGVGADLERQPSGALFPTLVIDGMTLGGAGD